MSSTQLLVSLSTKIKEMPYMNFYVDIGRYYHSAFNQWTIKLTCSRSFVNIPEHQTVNEFCISEMKMGKLSLQSNILQICRWVDTPHEVSVNIIRCLYTVILWQNLRRLLLVSFYFVFCRRFANIHFRKWTHASYRAYIWRY